MPRIHSVLLLAAATAAACAAPGPVPPPPGSDTRPSLGLALDLRRPARRAREAVEAEMGRPVPEGAATPLASRRAEMEAALIEELRPQVAFLHPDASPAARDLLLRATARASARSVVARYSPAEGRILVAIENIPAQMEAAGLPDDPATVRDFTTLVLAHEMVHAVDDAAHDLAGLFHSVPDAEALRALGMVVEGRAVHLARTAARRLDLPAAITGVLPGDNGDLDERRARFLLTYRDGAAFVAAVERRGGSALADRLLADPPRSTSTVFHPERWGPAGERPVPDLVPAFDAAAIPGAAAASELDLRARWLPRLGETAVTEAFAGFLAGAGVHRSDGGSSASVHEDPAAARAYAAALRRIYGFAAGETEGVVEGRAALVRCEGRVVLSVISPTLPWARELADRLMPWVLEVVAGE